MKRYEGRFGPAMGQTLQKTVEKRDPHSVLPQPDGSRRELEAVMKRSVYLLFEDPQAPPIRRTSIKSFPFLIHTYHKEPSPEF